MKNFFLILLLSGICFSTSYGQKVIDTISYKVPYLGKEGGQHILNMKLDKAKNDIVLNIYSHHKGGQLISNPEAIAKAKQEHSEKGFFGKLLSASEQSNQYKHVVLPIVMESRINTETKKRDEKKMIFYTANDVPKGSNVYFVPGSGITNITGFPEGSILKHHYTDVNKVFSFFPELGTDILTFGHIEYTGEGLVGIKNIKAKLVKKQAIFRYDPTKGFVTSAETINIANSSDLIKDSEANLVHKSDEISLGGRSVSWYENNKTNVFKLLAYNVNTDENQVKEFDFENKRDVKIANKSIYDSTGKKVRFLSIFGFDKKQDKSKKLYQEQEFNIVITDVDGNVKYNKTIEYGDKKAYKNVLTPQFVLQKENGNLLFSNFNKKTLLKGTYEICELDISNNTITPKTTYGYMLKIDGESGDTFSFLQDTDQFYKYGNGYIFIKNNEQTELQTKKKYIEGYNITLTDENLNPVKIYKNRIMKEKSKELPIKFFKIYEKDNEFVFLSRQGSAFTLTKINGTEVKSSFINTPYYLTSDANYYFGFFNQEPFINDTESRTLYLIDEFYETRDYNSKLINRVGITKVSY